MENRAGGAAKRGVRNDDGKDGDGVERCIGVSSRLARPLAENHAVFNALVNLKKNL